MFPFQHINRIEHTPIICTHYPVGYGISISDDSIIDLSFIVLCWLSMHINCIVNLRVESKTPQPLVVTAVEASLHILWRLNEWNCKLHVIICPHLQALSLGHERVTRWRTSCRRSSGCCCPPAWDSPRWRGASRSRPCGLCRRCRGREPTASPPARPRPSSSSSQRRGTASSARPSWLRPKNRPR